MISITTSKLLLFSSGLDCRHLLRKACSCWRMFCSYPPLFLTRKAQSAEITNNLKTKSQNCAQPELQKLEPLNVTRKAAAKQTSGQGPRTIPTKSDDRAHVSLTTVQNSTVREAEASSHWHSEHALELKYPQPLRSCHSHYMGRG